MTNYLSRNFLLMKALIKTKCGLEKYERLRGNTGFIGRIRFFWFMFFAILRDLPKRKT